MFHRPQRLVHTLADLALSRRCVICTAQLIGEGTIYGPLCLECAGRLLDGRERGKLCSGCGRPLLVEHGMCLRCRAFDFGFVNHRAVFRYDGEIAEIIQRYKINGVRPLHRFFAEALRTILPEQCTLVPVPARPKSRRSRPFDPVDLVTARSARKTGSALSRCLNRVDGIQQKKLSRDERLANVAEAFSVRSTMRETVAGGSFCLVDDVFTTGATLHACASVLLDAGAKNVFARTVAFD